MAGGFQRLVPMGIAPAQPVEDPAPPMIHPMGLSFRVCEALFPALGLDEGASVGETVRFAAFARVTATSYNEGEGGDTSCRIEMEIDYLSLGEGKMAELSDNMRPCLCLTEAECEKLDLDEECERGDMLHLIGTAKVTGSDDNPYMGKSLELQIVEMAVEDEDEEAEETE